jgi:catechol 2,3-dioxygenase-like lactoylglutathione lyase family enzyme
MKTEFDHIAITTKDVAASIEFYKKQFDDVEVLYEDSTWGYLKCGGIKIALVTSKEHPPHICFRVGSKAELLKYAAKTGSTIKVHRDKTESFYLYDSSRNAIEIIWYPES